jgi:hypothetical protein
MGLLLSARVGRDVVDGVTNVSAGADNDRSPSRETFARALAATVGAAARQAS